MLDKKPIRKMAQRYGLWRSQEMELFDDEIRLVYRSGPNRSARTIPVEWFDKNESEARIYPAWARRVFVLALLAVGASVAAGLHWGTAGYVASAVFAGIALAAAFLHQALAYDAIYFYSNFTGEFLFALRVDRPDRESVRAFVEQVKETAEKRRERAKMEMEVPSVGAELHHLARLREKEVISDEEFRRKKVELIEDLLHD